MKLSEQLSAVGGDVKKRICSVGSLLASLDKGEAEAVDGLLKDQNRVAAQLANVLKDAGHPISPDVLRRHRRGECTCK